MPHIPLIFIIAGEASGDQLGAELMASLKKLKEVRFAGIGGPAMTAQGLTSLFPMEELSLIGILGIVKNLPSLLKRLKFTVQTIKTLKPNAVITIDAPEFSLRVMKRIHKFPQKPCLIHYVAPTVWAWRPGMAKKISYFLDHLLCLYPFEPPYFEKYGLRTTFVGHPAVKDLVDFNTPHSPQTADEGGPSSTLRTTFRDNRDRNLLCVLPGSRSSEIKRLLPIFGETVKYLKKDLPDLKVVVPTLPFIENLVRQGTQNWSVEPQIVVGDEARKDTFQRASVALAASGTVALQLSAARLPFVIAYKLEKINEWVLRVIVHTPWACMVNILLAFKKGGPNFILTRKTKELIPEPWIPEFIQQDCTAEKLAPSLLHLLKNQEARARQISAMGEAMSLLKTAPATAATAILKEMEIY